MALSEFPRSRTGPSGDLSQMKLKQAGLDFHSDDIVSEDDHKRIRFNNERPDSKAEVRLQEKNTVLA